MDEESEPNTPREYVESKSTDGGLRLSLWRDPPPGRLPYAFLSDNYGLQHCGKMRVKTVEHMPSGVRYQPHEQGFKSFVNRLHTLSVGEAYKNHGSSFRSGFVTFEYDDGNLDHLYELFFLRGEWIEYSIENIS